MLALQRLSGNRAVRSLLQAPDVLQPARGPAVGGPVVQRRLIDDINRSLDGWGSDTDAIVRAANRAPPDEREAALRDPRLMHRLRDKLSRADALRALEALGAPLSQRLEVAMAGWGVDSAAVLRMIGSAPVAQKQAVLRNPALMAKLRDELSRADAVRAMEGLDAPLAERLYAAMSGWGCDSATVLRLARTASATQKEAALRDRALLTTLRGELSRADMLGVLEQLGASIVDRLNAAMDGGWGVDSAGILAMAAAATADQRREVLGNAALMARLRANLSLGDLQTVLARLQAPLAERIDVALGGWGVDVDGIATMVTAATPAERMAVHDDLGLMGRLQTGLGEAGYWRVRLLLRFGTQAQVDAPSPTVPAVSNGTFYRVDVHIKASERPEALATMVRALETGGALARGAYSEIVYDSGGAGEGLTTVTGFDHDAAAGTWTARSTPRVTVHPVGFTDVGWLYSTIMHEYAHVQQFNAGYNADPNSAVIVAADEVEAYLWEVEHATDSGLANNGPQLRDVGRRLTTHFGRLDAAHTATFQARYTAAMAVVNAAPAGAPAGAAGARSPTAVITEELSRTPVNTVAILDALRAAAPADREPVRDNRPLVTRVLAAVSPAEAREVLTLLGASMVDRVALLLDQGASGADMVALVTAGTPQERALVRGDRVLLDRLMTALSDTDAQALMTALGDSIVDTVDRALRLSATPLATVQSAIRSAAQPARDEVAGNSALMERMRGAFGEYEYWKVRLLLAHQTEAAFPAPVTTMVTTLAGTPAFATVRRTLVNLGGGDHTIVKECVGIREVLRALFPDDSEYTTLLRVLDEGLLSEETDVDRSFTEPMLTGPATAPFVPMNFSGPAKFDVAYFRDKLEVTVRINVSPSFLDLGARRYLPTAKQTWEQNIERAWNNKFKVKNGVHDIPVEFNANFTSGGAHHQVTAHSGVPAWPGLNMDNWYVPDPVSNPTGIRYVSMAAVHEFGHMIGNPDEYDAPTAHYSAVTGVANPAADPNTRTETDTTGQSRHTHTNSVMGGLQSAGPGLPNDVPGPVQARHLQYFLTWINANRRTNADGSFAEPVFTLY